MIMFQFSPSQKSFVRTGLLNNFRADGRTLSQRRTMDVKRNILDNLSGSSFVSINHGKSQIYTGIKIKVSECKQGVLPANVVALELTSMRRLNKQLSDCLSYLQQLLQQHFVDREVKQFTQLVIPNSKKHYLEMHIQSFIVSEPHLSLLEALFFSIKNALLSTSIPKLQCFLNEVTNEETVELGNQVEMLRLSAVDSLAVIGALEGRYILDLTPLQFQSTDAVYLLAISNNKVASIESLKGSISSDEVHKLTRFALNNSK